MSYNSFHLGHRLIKAEFKLIYRREFDHPLWGVDMRNKLEVVGNRTGIRKRMARPVEEAGRKSRWWKTVVEGYCLTNWKIN